MKSLHLNWIRNNDKSLVIPNVIFLENEEYGGCYYEPKKSEVMIDNKFYDLKFGLIVVSTNHPENIESTIAHEWRHHWQSLNGWKYDGIGLNSNPTSYWESIYNYFTKSKCEFDALRFEVNNCKSELTDMWLEYLCRRGVRKDKLIK